MSNNRAGKPTDLLQCSPAERRALRGRSIAMVLQDPKYSLNPVMRIGAQILESLQAHQRSGWAAAQARMQQALADVGIDDPVRNTDTRGGNAGKWLNTYRMVNAAALDSMIGAQR